MAVKIEPVTVLIVDDQHDNRQALKTMLASSDYRVLEAESAAEALQHLQCEDCAVILLDVATPGISGFELAMLIKQQPGTAAVPIIFLTAKAIDADLISKGCAVGAADYLIKPLLPEVVRAKLSVFAQLYRQRRHIEWQAALLLEAERRESELRLAVERCCCQAEAERDFLYRKALGAVQARDEFLSIASHELRTPLTSLQLLVGTLLRAADRNPAWRENGGAQIVDRLTVADRQISRLARLIDQLLDVSRISAGQFQVEMEEIDLAAIVQDVVIRFADDAARAGCEVRVRIDGPTVGHWDRVRIEQVLVNLFTNALKFGEGRPIDIELAGDGEQTRLRVRDYGIGIPPEAQERIFQRFERAASSREYGGLGLGLYITQRIIEAHGGRISLESTPGEGAAFTVVLPYCSRRPSQAALPIEDLVG